MKRIIAAALAAVLVATSAPAVSNASVVVTKNAAISVQEADTAKLEKGETVTVSDNGVEQSVAKDGDSITISAVSSNKKTVKIVGTVNSTKVTKISASAFKNCKKAKTIDLTDVELTSLQKNQFKGAKKAKTVKINATKLTAKNINSKALKGFKGKKIVLTCKDKKTFNALVKKLKKSASKDVTFVFKKA